MHVQFAHNGAHTFATHHSLRSTNKPADDGPQPGSPAGSNHTQTPPLQPADPLITGSWMLTKLSLNKETKQITCGINLLKPARLGIQSETSFFLIFLWKVHPQSAWSLLETHFPDKSPSDLTSYLHKVIHQQNAVKCIKQNAYEFDKYLKRLPSFHPQVNVKD